MCVCKHKHLQRGRKVSYQRKTKYYTIAINIANRKNKHNKIVNDNFDFIFEYFFFCISVFVLLFCFTYFT